MIMLIKKPFSGSCTR